MYRVFSAIRTDCFRIHHFISNIRRENRQIYRNGIKVLKRPIIFNPLIYKRTVLKKKIKTSRIVFNQLDIFLNINFYECVKMDVKLSGIVRWIVGLLFVLVALGSLIGIEISFFNIIVDCNYMFTCYCHID